MAETILLEPYQAKGAALPGRIAVKIEVEGPAREALGRFTAAHLGRELKVIVDGETVMRPKLMTPIDSGTFVIESRPEAPSTQHLLLRLARGGARLEISAD